MQAPHMRAQHLYPQCRMELDDLGAPNQRNVHNNGHPPLFQREIQVVAVLPNYVRGHV